MCVKDHKPLFRQTGETNSETRFSLKFVNVGDEQKFPKTSVCIILVDLVYLESAKICTGSKIVRGLKRLRTSELEQRFPKYGPKHGSRRVEKWVAPRGFKSIKTNVFLFIFHVLSILSKTELLHHTHFIWLRLIKTGLLHHRWFSESFNGNLATSHN